MSLQGFGGFYWDIDVQVSGVSVRHLVENGGASLAPIGGTDPYPSNVRHVFEITMEVGDRLTLLVADNYFPYVNQGSLSFFRPILEFLGMCITGEKTHECTFLTGRLILRL